MKRERLDIEVDGLYINLNMLKRDGCRDTLLFLHGFGGTKEDYADIVHYSAFDGFTVIAYDAPGCGQSFMTDPNAVNIPFLVKAAEQLFAHYNLRDVHLVGHSMGGLTALLLADILGTRIRSFCNIEGNLAPEDCFLSRQAITDRAERPESFWDSFIARNKRSYDISVPLYAASLEGKVNPLAARPILSSIANLSDEGHLLQTFLKLPCEKMFLYGEANRTLTYLKMLRDHGICMAEIPNAGHFPMYANPPAMWAALARFLENDSGRGAV